MAEKVDRLTRVNALLKRELAEAIERDLVIPSGMLVSVTEVNVSVDLRNATVYVSIFGGKASDRQAVMHLVIGVSLAMFIFYKQSFTMTRLLPPHHKKQA